MTGGGCCAIGARDRPSYGVCLSSCDKYVGPPRRAIATAYWESFLDPICEHCGNVKRPESVPAETTKTELLQVAGGRILLGDRIAAGFASLGIPECPGCGTRKRWLNRLHERIAG